VTILSECVKSALMCEFFVYGSFVRQCVNFESSVDFFVNESIVSQCVNCDLNQRVNCASMCHL
jgi:predicted nucleotidyltransferase